MRVLLVLHIAEYRINEIIDIWYDRSELNLIRDECRRTVAIMEEEEENEKETKGTGMILSSSSSSMSSSSMTTNDDFCPRGLENRTQEGFRRKLQCRMAGWNAVLKEQEEQQKKRIRRVGVSSSSDASSERMAALYITLVAPCVLVAQQLALLDEEAVCRILPWPTVV
jgi:hypothetical protein